MIRLFARFTIDVRSCRFLINRAKQFFVTICNRNTRFRKFAPFLWDRSSSLKFSWFIMYLYFLAKSMLSNIKYKALSSLSQIIFKWIKIDNKYLIILLNNFFFYHYLILIIVANNQLNIELPNFNILHFTVYIRFTNNVTKKERRKSLKK